MKTYGFSKVLHYIPKLLLTTIRLLPLARIAIFVAIVGVILEYATLSLMLMFSPIQESSSIVLLIMSMWQHVTVEILGFSNKDATWIWMFLFMLGVRISLAFVQLGLATRVSKQMMSHLSIQAFSRVLLKEPMAKVYAQSIGYYTAIAGDEAARIGQIFFHLMQFSASFVAAIIGLLMIFLFEMKIFLLTLVFLFLAGVGVKILYRKVFLLSDEVVCLSRAATTTFIEGFNGIRSIRSMGGENFVVGQYKSQQTRYGYVLFLLDMMNYGAKTLPALVLLLFALVALYPSAGYFSDISSIYFLAVATMLIRVLSFFGTALASGGRAAIDIRAAFDIGEVIGESQKQTPRLNVEKSIRLPSISSIRMTEVSCGYLNSEPVLIGVSATMNSGCSYALTGESGSGKSTLSDVLLGLLPPVSGVLHVGNYSYQDIDLTLLRQKVILVEQQTRIFTGTVRENIAFGLPLSDEQINKGIYLSELTDFIHSLPEGLDTELEYQGANLSGGQKQRIGLARAIVRNPDVLILDEATSALDPQTRNSIVEKVLDLYKNKIVLFITHDSYITKKVHAIWHIEESRLCITKRDNI